MNLKEIISLYKGREKTIEDIANASMLFYGNKVPDYAELNASLGENVEKGKQAIKYFCDNIAQATWTKEGVYELIKKTLTDLEIKMPVLAIPLRILVTGEKRTPEIDSTLQIFGKDRVLSRLKTGLENWK